MKKIILAVAVAALAVMAVASYASASGVARYQVENATLMVKLSPDNVHYYDIFVNPCDGTFTGSATGAGVNGGFESIVGTMVGDNLTFTATIPRET